MYRGRIARKFFEIVARAAILKDELRLSATFVIQRNWRGLVARRKARLRRDYKDLIYRSAVKMQFAWYRHNDNYTTFLLMRGLWHKELRTKQVNS